MACSAMLTMAVLTFRCGIEEAIEDPQQRRPRIRRRGDRGSAEAAIVGPQKRRPAGADGVLVRSAFRAESHNVSGFWVAPLSEGSRLSGRALAFGSSRDGLTDPGASAITAIS